MPPEPRFVPRFVAEPPQEPLPYGRWAHRLEVAFREACAAIDSGDEQLGEPDAVTWFPDRSYAGRTYVPATARTDAGFEVFGAVSFAVPPAGEAPDALQATADYTAETAEHNPDWRLDLSDEVIGAWRGEEGRVAEMTLVWGVALVRGGAIATAELTDLAVDQCPLDEERFTLVAPDAYRSDLLEIRLYDDRSRELARESLYVEEDDDPEEDAV